MQSERLTSRLVKNSATIVKITECHSEEWRVIPGYDGYEVSCHGRIRRSKAGKGTRIGKIRLPSKTNSGYWQVDVWIDGKRFKLYVHKAVALAFDGPRPSPKHEAAHHDGDQLNNVAGNVAWKTRPANEADKDVHGTRPKGITHANSKLSETDVRQIRERRAAGEGLSAIALDYGVNFQNVSLICLGKTWVHVK